jgi:hypothetical protein
MDCSDDGNDEYQYHGSSMVQPSNKGLSDFLVSLVFVTVSGAWVSLF